MARTVGAGLVPARVVTQASGQGLALPLLFYCQLNFALARLLLKALTT